MLKTSSIKVETLRSTPQSDSIVRQTKKRSSFLNLFVLGYNQQHFGVEYWASNCSTVALLHFEALTSLMSPQIYKTIILQLTANLKLTGLLSRLTLFYLYLSSF